MRVAVITTPRGGTAFDAKRKIIQWPGTSSDRKWLQNHLHHCMNSDKSVTLQPFAVEFTITHPSEGNR